MHSFGLFAESSVEANIRPIVFCSAVQYGGESYWNFLFDKFQNETVANERDLKLTALTCTREPSIIKRMLVSALNERSNILRQDIARMYVGFSSNPVAVPIAFDFVVDNVDVLRA